MMKLIITESQYNRLFLKENKELNFNFDVDTILGFTKLIGIPLKGQNEFLANKALENKKIVSKIYSILTDSEEETKMSEDLINKGMKNSNEKIVSNAEKIVKNFNEYSSKLGLKQRLTMNTLINNALKN